MIMALLIFAGCWLALFCGILLLERYLRRRRDRRSCGDMNQGAE